MFYAVSRADSHDSRHSRDAIRCRASCLMLQPLSATLLRRFAAARHAVTADDAAPADTPRAVTFSVFQSADTPAQRCYADSCRVLPPPAADVFCCQAICLR